MPTIFSVSSGNCSRYSRGRCASGRGPVGFSPFLQSLAGENPSGPRPDVQRPREYLEQFPLDTLKMVGTLRLGGGNYGLVQTKDGLIHRVLPGNHLGQNDGRVMAVSEAKIVLVEIIPDGLGGYLERPAALALAD